MPNNGSDILSGAYEIVSKIDYMLGNKITHLTKDWILCILSEHNIARVYKIKRFT
jgi:hypothetical protein